LTVRPFHLPAYRQLPEPPLLFHATRPDDRNVHPLKGLLAFGPYSRSVPYTLFDPIRVAIIAPHGALTAIDGLLAEIERRQTPKERRNYLVEFPGFSRVFGVRVVTGPAPTRIELPPQLGAEIAEAVRPHMVLAEALTRALARLETVRTEFDVVIIYLPDAWQRCWTSEDEDFDLHDYLKAITASRGMPSQIVREDKALTYFCRASVAWRLGIALYCKAGGVPWKLADAPTDTAYIGLSYAMRDSENTSARFVTCCSQVFDAEGGGLEFIAYETDDIRIERDNPFLTRADMRRVMARSLRLYQGSHGGESPRRIVVHKSTEFKSEEVDGCFDALNVPEVELIQIQDDVPWRAVLLDRPPPGQNKAPPANYPVERGAMLQLGGREALVWTQGNAPSAVDGKNFFKEGKGIPAPLLLRRFAGHGALDTVCSAVLALSKMDWNNDSLYDRLPVTVSYAQVLARTVRRMPKLAPTPYPFRLFM
jgi:hypothetical protein